MISYMSDETNANPLNAPGTFYNDLSCIDCNLCPEAVPSVFRRDDEEGYSYVFKQPQTKEEKAAVIEAIQDCPTESIGQR